MQQTKSSKKKITSIGQTLYRIGKELRKMGRFLWTPIGVGLSALNQACLFTAWLLKVFQPEPVPRRVVLLLIFVSIFYVALLAPPVVAFVSLCLGLWMVMAISRAWAYAENLRGLIAKKVGFTEPPAYINRPAGGIEHGPQHVRHLTDWLAQLPDLRWSAPACALMLIFLLPLLCLRLHQLTGMFPAEEATSFTGWSAFVLTKTYVRILPELARLLGWDILEIESVGWGGQAVLLGMRLMVFYILIQAIRRALDIRRDVRDAVKAVSIDPEMPALLGERAFEPLLHLYRQEDLGLERRANILTALGILIETGGLNNPAKRAETYRLLHQAISMKPDGGNREALAMLQGEAAITLAKLRLSDSIVDLTELLQSDHSSHVQRKAAQALGMFRLRTEEGQVLLPDEFSHAAIQVLLDRLKEIRASDLEISPNVLKEIADAIGLLLEGEPESEFAQQAMELILREPSLLAHRYRRVRNRAAMALGRIGTPEAAEPLMVMLQGLKPYEDPELRSTVAEALGRLQLPADSPRRREVSDYLLNVLRKEEENEAVRLGFARGLARLGEESALDTLTQMLRDAVDEDRTAMVRHLHEVFELYGANPLREAEAIIATADTE